MKKGYLSLFVISSISIICSFISCSNSQESKLVYTESNTIKQSVKEKEQDITWTAELEGERLSQIVNRNSMTLGADVIYNKDLYKISKQNRNPVFPSISKFGSLDTSSLDISVKNKLNDFCKAFAGEKHNGAESFFSKKYIFNYVFFINDYNEGWKKHFGESSDSDSEIFSKWIFGEPFNGNEIIQIPVRFYTDCGTIDMTVFLKANGNNEFYQITIDRWNKV